MSGPTLRTASAEAQWSPPQEFVTPTWVLRIPDPGCGFLTSNAARRNTWHVNRRVTAKWRGAAGWLAKADVHRPRLQRAQIVVIAHHRDRRVRDAANLAPTAKAAIDGLVDAGLLPDDDDAHLIGPDLRTGDVVRPPGVAYLDVLVYRLQPFTKATGARPTSTGPSKTVRGAR